MPTPPKPYQSAFRNEFLAGRREADDDGHALAYQEWQAAGGTPEANAKFLTAVEPVLRSAASTYAGDDGPLALSRARLIALDALPRYDPAKAGLGTYLHSHLKGLRRVSRQQSRPVAAAERVAFGRARSQQIEDELEHELGRPASAAEVAAKMGVSVDRLAEYAATRPGVSEGAFEDDIGGAAIHPSQQAWVDLVYGDLGARDQVIMDYSLGLHGRPRLSNAALALKLGVTPGAVSQRKAKLQAMLDESSDLSPFG